MEQDFKELEEGPGKKVADNCGVRLWRVMPSNCVLSGNYMKHWQKLRDFPVTDGDIWVISQPKSGTTWTQEMSWLLGHNCDFETAKKVPLDFRMPHIEHQVIVRSEEGVNPLQQLLDMPAPRYIKCHLPTELLPQQIWKTKAKIIYVARDPKDVAVSYYHYMRTCYGYSGSIDDFLEAFLDESLPYGPYWAHILGYWKLRDQPNVLFTTYEEMKRDLPAAVRRCARFMSTDVSEDLLQKLVDHLSFDNMKTNPAVNKEGYVAAVRKGMGLDPNAADLPKFMRRGQPGGWRNEFPPGFAERFDKWIQEKTSGTGYTVGISGGHA
ncbi:luciferin sulfotransferase-like [Schistocerca piceifrons]|uniref:luciferin sulfotransferase-like n=1 Tax=Schistocerca piceifrons TaxID=274613 RepID=UPI001F5EFA23|nr:luciferin sulfotransferase-like [Schistocerca piceifrons]